MLFSIMNYAMIHLCFLVATAKQSSIIWVFQVFKDTKILPFDLDFEVSPKRPGGVNGTTFRNRLFFFEKKIGRGTYIKQSEDVFPICPSN